MKKISEVKIADKLNYYIKKGRIDADCPQFYKVFWYFAEGYSWGKDKTSIPVFYKYILVSDLEKNPKLFNAIKKREQIIDESYPYIYESPFSLMSNDIKLSIAFWRYERELKKSKVKAYTEEEKDAYIKNQQKEKELTE